MPSRMFRWPGGDASPCTVRSLPPGNGRSTDLITYGESHLPSYGSRVRSRRKVLMKRHSTVPADPVVGTGPPDRGYNSSV